jgi:hypothetical protein
MPFRDAIAGVLTSTRSRFYEMLIGGASNAFDAVTLTARRSA